MLSFDRSTGYSTQWLVNGRNLLLRPSHTSTTTRSPLLSPSFWQLATDNDKPSDAKAGKFYGLDSLTSQLRAINITYLTADRNTIEVTTKTHIAPPILAWGLHITTIFLYRRRPHKMSHQACRRCATYTLPYRHTVST